MALKRNLEYGQISFKNPELVADEYYFFDEIIIEDQELIRKVERLRELIIRYCSFDDIKKCNRGKPLLLNTNFR
jgi:hypothetical protein